VDIRLIATDADYEEAIAEIKRLWASEAGSPDRGKLELLAMLAHRFEREREPLPPLDPVQAIRFRMEQKGLERKDLLPIFGTSARASEILSGKRALTLEMIRKLHLKLDIPLESLIQPAKRRARAKAAAKTTQERSVAPKAGKKAPKANGKRRAVSSAPSARGGPSVRGRETPSL